MNPLLMDLLKYAGQFILKEVSQYIEGYFAQPDPVSQDIKDLIAMQQSDYQQLEAAVNQLLPNAYVIGILSKWQSYNQAVSGTVTKANIADFTAFFDITSADNIATGANNLYQALFGTLSPVGFAYSTASASGSGSTAAQATLGSNSYLVIQGHNLMSGARNDLRAWGDQMIGLALQITGYYSALTNCAQIAANVLRTSDLSPYKGYSDDQLGSSLNVNPAIWQGTGLVGLIGDRIAQYIKDAYPFLYGMYEQIFVNSSGYATTAITNHGDTRILAAAIEATLNSADDKPSDSHGVEPCTAPVDSKYNAGWTIAAAAPGTPANGTLTLSNSATNQLLGIYNLSFVPWGSNISVQHNLIATSPLGSADNTASQWKLYPYLAAIGGQQLFMIYGVAGGGFLCNDMSYVSAFDSTNQNMFWTVA